MVKYYLHKKNLPTLLILEHHTSYKSVQKTQEVISVQGAPNLATLIKIPLPVAQNCNCGVNTTLRFKIEPTQAGLRCKKPIGSNKT